MHFAFVHFLHDALFDTCPTQILFEGRAAIWFFQIFIQSLADASCPKHIHLHLVQQGVSQVVVQTT